MWWIAEYEAVTLFSLKLSMATASGGKTLLVPTPYAIKMALVDAACRTAGVTQAEQWWPAIRDLGVALRPTQQAVVTNLFQKVLRPRRNAADLAEPDAGPFQRTIGYREYVQLVGRLGIALDWGGSQPCDWLHDLLVNVNYLGKRGSFMQLTTLPCREDALPPGFVQATAPTTVFAVNGTPQLLDDCTPTLTFAKANVYSREKVHMGKERITRPIVLPYRLVRSSKSYTLYERLDE